MPDRLSLRFISLKSRGIHPFLVGGQESRGFKVPRQDNVGDQTDGDGHQSLDDEDPMPAAHVSDCAGEMSLAVQFIKSCRKESSKPERGR